MNALQSKPLLKFFPAGGFELHQHLAFLHIHQDAAGRNLSSSVVQARREILRALTGKAGQRVL